METAMKYNPSLESNLTEAFQLMRQNGIVARKNFECCQGCGCAAIADLIKKQVAKNKTTVGYCFYHRQDNDNKLDTGRFYLAYGTPGEGDSTDPKVTATDVGNIICECLKQVGLLYQWDGTGGNRIRVSMTMVDEERKIREEGRVEVKKLQDAYRVINTKEDLVEIAKFLKVRPDWHEPDEQMVDVRVVGSKFDNAGVEGELAVRLLKEVLVSPGIFRNVAVAEINLATLFAIASDNREE